MKSLLEIQAIQSIGTSNNNTTSLLSGSSSVFSDMIDEVLSNASTGLETDVSNMLGSYNSLASSPLLSQSKNNASAIAPLADNPYLASLMYSKGIASANNYLNTSVTQSIDQYRSTDFTGTTAFGNILAGAETYADSIAKASATYNIPEKLLAAVMKQESNFNPAAVSSAGATGLMQLMPSTAKYLGVADSTNPEQNIMGGAKYLRQMLDKFDNNISTALAAYNAGPGNVNKYNGIPPFKETMNYVKKVMNYYQT